MPEPEFEVTHPPLPPEELRRITAQHTSRDAILLLREIERLRVVESRALQIARMVADRPEWLAGDMLDGLRTTIKGALSSRGHFGIPPVIEGLAQVKSALLVNGPGEGKIACLLATDGYYHYERIQQPKATYVIRQFGIPAMTGRVSTGLHMYLVGYVAEAPTDEEIRKLIADAKFDPFKFDKREPRN